MSITWGCAQWRFWNTFASITFLSCKRLHTNVSSDEGFEIKKQTLLPCLSLNFFTSRMKKHSQKEIWIIIIQYEIQSYTTKWTFERVTYCNNQLLHKIEYNIINLWNPPIEFGKYHIWKFVFVVVLCMSCMKCELALRAYHVFSTLVLLPIFFQLCYNL